MVDAVLPVTRNPNSGSSVSATPICNPDGSLVGGSSQAGFSFATSQVASSVSPAAAAQIVAPRAGRQAVTLSNVTGTQAVYFLASAATTGAATGFFIPAGAGASVTIPTSAAVFATSPTAAQTISVLETF